MGSKMPKDEDFPRASCTPPGNPGSDGLPPRLTKTYSNGTLRNKAINTGAGRAVASVRVAQYGQIAPGLRPRGLGDLWPSSGILLKWRPNVDAAWKFTALSRGSADFPWITGSNGVVEKCSLC